MTLTHTEDHTNEPFVPRYARTGKSAKRRSTVHRATGVATHRKTKSGGKVKAWMILAPIGVVALGGAGALMFMGGDGAQTLTPAPASEPVAMTAQPLAAQPLTTASAPVAAGTSDMTNEAAAVAATPAPVAALVPARRNVATSEAPRRPAPATRQSDPVAERTPDPVVVPAGPQPYSAAATPSPTSAQSATQGLNTATTPSPAPSTPAQAPAPRFQPIVITTPAG